MLPPYKCIDDICKPTDNNIVKMMKIYERDVIIFRMKNGTNQAFYKSSGESNATSYKDTLFPFEGFTEKKQLYMFDNNKRNISVGHFIKSYLLGNKSCDVDLIQNKKITDEYMCRYLKQFTSYEHLEISIQYETNEQLKDIQDFVFENTQVYADN